MSHPTVRAIGQAMVEAGILTEEDYMSTRRIVIDLPADGIPIMYIERYVDHKLLSVFTTLDGIEIQGRILHGANPGLSEGGERRGEEEDPLDPTDDISPGI